ncbi:MAG TPA: hypothetical protein PKA64_13980, partial [Myxococcota bacterium]|nr:hypothetical protein [Myxococcota bacterium]
RVFRYEGEDIFASFTRPISSPADLAALVRPVLERDLRPALGLAFSALHRLGPHVAVVARGLGDVLVAVQGKVSAITGDEGIGGIVGGVEEIADMLRDLDLTPITDPLDAIWARVEGAWGALDPANLRPLLQAFSDAVKDILDLHNLIDPETTAQLDATWLGLIDRLGALSPRELVARVLDPAYEQAMKPVQRVLDLPDRLQDLVDVAAEHVPDDAIVQIGRVEVAFDAMLRALPLGGGGSVSASASVSVG